MARVRIYQLAKEIDISSKEMMDILLEIGMDVKSPSSTIEERMAETVKEIISERRLKEAHAEAEPQPEPEPTVTAEVPPEPVEKKPAEPPVAVEPIARTPATGKVAPVEPPAPAPAEVPAPPPPPSAKRKLTRKERRAQVDREVERPHPQPAKEKLPERRDEVTEPFVTTEHRHITIPASITVRELAERSGVPATLLLSKLLASKILRSVNQTISSDVASHILEEFNISVEVDRRRTRIEGLSEEEKANLVPVAPVVTIMGHVDHGKTTLLDNIRKTNVAATEAGQITQKIGAYEVTVTDKNTGEDRKIVFLDTPGHEAFTMMRARGAHVTDIAVLVVAADDGVMPQTLEAIDHARAANVPILVAINKIDKPESNVDRVKQQLTEAGLVPEEWGGDTIVMEVSAKQGTGVEEILEMLLLVADMEDLRANPKGKVQGVVIESQLDPQRGPIATVLIQQGTLATGDYVVAGSCCGRVRAMFNYRGEEIRKAGPATPVGIIGLDAAPHASDILRVVADGKVARLRADEFARESRAGGLSGIQRITLDDLFAQIQKGEVKDLNIIVKADVHGSVEALCQSLAQLEHEEVTIKIIHRGVGNVNESDVMLASASNAIVLGFGVSVDTQAQIVAERERVDIHTYDVIYDAINTVKAAMLGLLEPVYEERLLGEAEVRATFRSSRIGIIAGCMVLSGTIRRNTKVRLLRGNQVVFEGVCTSLRHLKEDMTEIPAGMECGISLEGCNDYQVGDIIQCWVKEEIPRTFSDLRPDAKPRAAAVSS